jgi:WD40 repeat protein
MKPKVQTHWNAAQQTLEGHSRDVTSVAFSPDGKLLPSLLVSNHWVIKGDMSIIWLPPDYREICSLTWNESLVMGHSSGRISFFCFKKGAKLVI